MEIQNSLVEHMLHVFASLLRDVASMYPDVSVSLDLNYVETRVLSEGASFFTKSLPLLGKHIDVSLGSGTTLSVPGFTKSKGRVTPRFLGWLLERVFDSEGRELPDACPLSVRHLRQLAYFFYKLELPYAKSTNEKIIRQFEQTDEELANRPPLSEADLLILHTAHLLIKEVVSGVQVEGFIPRHGPGSVSTGERHWNKMRFKRFYPTLDEVFPYCEYFFSGAMDICDNYHELHRRVASGPGTAKVVLVPKDSRGPRLISCEPVEYQFVQQAISRELVRVIENHPLTAGRVNFSDQSINRRFAYLGSLGARWVTLDMKDASDRVSLHLVETLFRDTHLLKYLLASRSPSTCLPNGKIVLLNKFAPMGSALCFPVESLVFWALSVACCMHVRPSSVHSRFERDRAVVGVRVYGDDLIMRTEDYGAALQFFPKVGLMFNLQKCCTSGFFRESCGMDAYKGIDVTPVRYRTVWVPRSSATKQLLSSVEMSNHLYSHGYWESADLWMELIVRKYGQIPIVDHNRPVSFICFRRLTSSVYEPVLLPTKYCKKHHRVLIKTLVPISPRFKRALTGYEKLRWKLIQPANHTRAESRCLKTYASKFSHLPATEVRAFPLRRRVTHKRRWCSYEQ
jgi:hypothetical protein